MMHEVLRREQLENNRYKWHVKLIPETQGQLLAIERYISGDFSDGQRNMIEYYLNYRISVDGNDLYHTLEVVDKKRNPFVVKMMKIVPGEILKEPPPPPIEW